jgi:D-aminopeptidase
MKLTLLLVTSLFAIAALADAPQPRARDLGIPFDGEPGPLNAITDVAGVTVGHVTIIRDLPENRAVRTGVTAILPRGRDSLHANVYAGWTVLNGNGEMTGASWLEEGGFLEGPVMLTNTHSIGAVHEGVIKWRVTQKSADHTDYFWSSPVVTETWDGYLNDINGFHVRAEHVAEALDSAAAGGVAEGSVGGGTGMTCFDFKCGIGTASRIVDVDGKSYTVGILVQSNFGSRENFRVAGIPVGQQMPGDPIYAGLGTGAEKLSSCVVVLATDAPLLPHQLDRLARRVALGLGRTGSVAHNGSGDFFVAFSTANLEAGQGSADASIRSVPNDSMNPLFTATVEATEEAIVNALIAGRDMSGDLGHIAKGIDHELLRAILRRHGRLLE